MARSGICVAVWLAAGTVSAQEAKATIKSTVTLPRQEIVFPATNARAIVAARIPDDRPKDSSGAPMTDGPWPCRLIHSDPMKRSLGEFSLHVNKGALLALVNLTGKPAMFGFRQQIFVEGGTSFTLEPNEVKILQVREDASVPETDTVNSDILLSADDGCFGGPGPKIYVP